MIVQSLKRCSSRISSLIQISRRIPYVPKFLFNYYCSFLTVACYLPLLFWYIQTANHKYIFDLVMMFIQCRNVIVFQQSQSAFKKCLSQFFIVKCFSKSFLLRKGSFKLLKNISNKQMFVQKCQMIQKINLAFQWTNSRSLGML